MEGKDVIKQRDHLRDVTYSTLHSQIREALEYYRGKVLPKVPGDFKAHIPPTAKVIPETLAAALAPSDIDISVPPRTEEERQGGKGAKHQATSMEMAHKDWLHRLDIQYGFSIIHEMIKLQLIAGYGPLKAPLLNIDLWPKKPKREKKEHEEDYLRRVNVYENTRRTRLPFDAHVLSPLNVFPDPIVFRGGEPSYVIESYKRPRYEVEKYVPLEGKGEFEEIEWTEYWGREQRIYMVGNDIVDTKRNPYGRPPYRFAFSGLGILSPEGKPEDRAVGVMYPILSLLAAEIRTLTMWDVVAQIYGVPPLVKLTEFESKVDFTPAFINEADVKVGPLFDRVPQVGQILLELLATIHDLLELATYSRTLAAVKLAGVSTGIQQQLITLQAYKRYEPMTRSLEYIWGQVGGNIAQLVEEKSLKEVSEYIKPSDIKGYYVCEPRFVIVDALQRQADIEEMSQLRPFYSIESLRDSYHPIEAAVDEAERMMKELVMQSPSVTEPLAMEMTERAVGSDVLNKVREIGKDIKKQTGRQSTPTPGQPTGVR